LTRSLVRHEDGKIISLDLIVVAEFGGSRGIPPPDAPIAGSRAGGPGVGQRRHRKALWYKYLRLHRFRRARIRLPPVAEGDTRHENGGTLPRCRIWVLGRGSESRGRKMGCVYLALYLPAVEKGEKDVMVAP
jgi:hypothetical protein